MKGPRTRAHRQRWLQKDRNGEQYAFKEENIEGIYQNHLYVPNFLLPADGAMTISGYWHVDIFRKAL